MKKVVSLFALLAVIMATPVMAESTKDISEYPLGDRSIFSERAVIDRIKLTGDVCLEGQPCAAAVVAAPAAAGGAPRTGEQMVTAICSGCHAAGVMGAPVIGNKALWAPRIAQGKATLYQHALNGIRSMPPKGGCAACQEQEIKNAVDYLVSKAQ